MYPQAHKQEKCQKPGFKLGLLAQTPIFSLYMVLSLSLALSTKEKKEKEKASHCHLHGHVVLPYPPSGVIKNERMKAVCFLKEPCNPQGGWPRKMPVRDCGVGEVAVTCN